jgi:sigma-B regulation protein RsbU (phosphoserine phosphatase)
VELAVEALQGGGGDFVLKPWDNKRLLTILRTQLEQGRARREAQRRQSKKEILISEVQEAREIQRGLLPSEIFQPAGYQISTAWQPAILIGGDYFDVFQASETRTALCIADVTGKGLPAALLMSNLQAAVRSSAGQALEPKDVCAKVNSVLCTHDLRDKFITCFYALLDSPHKRLVYTNAGHNPPILVRHDGSHILLREGGPVLGAFPEWNYEQDEASLAPGDRLVLFTDGVTEATNAGDEEFGEERLTKLVVDSRGLSAQDLQARILDAVTEFTGGDFQDDATLIVMAIE